jgi:hypothetical protein
MKKLLGIMVLGLLMSGNAYSAKISDFEVAGMSIDESALKYYSEKKLIDNYQDWFAPKYSVSEIEEKKDSFDDIQLIYKPNDSEFKIEGISALEYIDGKECQKKLDNEASSIQGQFTPQEVKFYKKKTFKHSADKSGKSKVTSVKIKFKSDKGVLIIACYDWSDSYAAKMDYNDNLRFSIRSKSYANFLNRR